MDKSSNEVSLVLVKEKQELVDSLSQIQKGQELAMVIKKESGFNFLEEFSIVQANVQSETQSQSDQKESVQEPVQQGNQTSSEPLDAFIMEKYEQGITPGGVSFAKMYVMSVASNAQTMVFAQGEVAVQKTQHLIEGDKFTMQTRTENGFTFFEKLGDADKG